MNDLVNIQSYEYKWLLLIGILLFFAMRVAVGYWASRKVSNATDYIVAGRRLPVYIAAASIMATWFAAETLMGAAATAYKSGLQGVVFDPFGAVLCLLISGVFFVRLMRRARYLTVVDFFERRYGRAMGLLGSLAQLAAYFAWTAAQFVAGGHILNKLLGWPLPVGMVAVGTIVTLYTTMGGMWADTLLDFIQMFFTAGGIAVLFFYVLDAVGGWSGMVTDAASLNGPHALTLLPIAGDAGYLGYGGTLGWMYWAAAWMSLGLGSVACQDLMQRSMSARNEAASVWGTYLAAALYFVFGIMSPLVGIMMFKLDPHVPIEQLDGLLVMATVRFLPPLLATLFIAALASALMSTSDSSILAGASVVTENIVPFFRPNAGDVQKLRWTRIGVVVIGVISVGIAVAISNIYRLATISWSLLLVGLFVPFACGMYWRKANRSGAIAGFLGGFIAWLAGVFYLLPTTRAQNTLGEKVDLQNAVWDAVYIASTPAVLVSLVALVAVSLLTQRWDAPMPLTDVDGHRLPLRRRLGILPPQDIL
jgi:SSS family solute:Na+ symporter